MSNTRHTFSLEARASRADGVGERGRLFVPLGGYHIDFRQDWMCTTNIKQLDQNGRESIAVRGLAFLRMSLTR